LLLVDVPTLHMRWEVPHWLGWVIYSLMQASKFNHC